MWQFDECTLILVRDARVPLCKVRRYRLKQLAGLGVDIRAVSLDNRSWRCPQYPASSVSMSRTSALRRCSTTVALLTPTFSASSPASMRRGYS